MSSADITDNVLKNSSLDHLWKLYYRELELKFFAQDGSRENHQNNLLRILQEINKRWHK